MSKRIRLELRKLHRELGATIISVTHDQEEAPLLSDRTGLINNARIAQIDAPSALCDRPRTRFAATFIGDEQHSRGLRRWRRCGRWKLSFENQAFRRSSA